MKLINILPWSIVFNPSYKTINNFYNSNMSIVISEVQHIKFKIRVRECVPTRNDVLT